MDGRRRRRFLRGFGGLPAPAASQYGIGHVVTMALLYAYVETGRLLEERRPGLQGDRCAASVLMAKPPSFPGFELKSMSCATSIPDDALSYWLQNGWVVEFTDELGHDGVRCPLISTGH